MKPLAWLFSVFAVLIAGCGPTMVTVTGNVTMNGTPVPKGVIDVSSVDAKSADPPAQAEIVDGMYRIQVSIGSKQVRISAPVVTGRRPEFNSPNAPLVETTIESIPAKYNSATELTWDVTKVTKSKDWPLEAAK